MVSTRKKIALLHRYPKEQIKETNAAYPYLSKHRTLETKTFKKFNRVGRGKFWKSLLWIVYAPLLVLGRGYKVIYCDDSYPFYPALVKLASPSSKVVLRIGDFHLMYYYKGLTYKFLHWLEILSWNAAERIIAISEVMAEEIRTQTETPVFVVLDPVDPKDFPDRAHASFNTVMFHGTLTKNKNLEMFLDAARLLPHLAFEIVGDGPERERLMSLSPSNVTFSGWWPHSRIHEKIASCSVGVAMRGDNPGNEYVVTSPYLQYGIMGKPCAVSKRKVYRDYPWQFHSAETLAMKIRVLIESPNEGKHLRKHILKHHDAEKIASQIWKILSFR